VNFAPAVSGDWSAFAFGQDGVFIELKSAAEKGLSKAGLMLFMQLDQGAVVRKEMGRDVTSIAGYRNRACEGWRKSRDYPVVWLGWAGETGIL